jgi:uncharacterized protein YnzC (UPF0291/DUF896 family)
MALSICLIATTTPSVARASPVDLEIDQEELSDHLDLADHHLSAVEKHKASNMDLTRFEKNLSKTLNHLQKRTEHKLQHASDKRISNHYKKFKEISINSSEEVVKNKIMEIDGKEISDREKLRELNGDSFKLNVQNHLMSQIKEAGSVRAYVKQIRAALKEQRKNHRESHKAQGEASLKIKTNEIQKEALRLPAQSAEKAGGISLGSLLLITGIILVVLGPSAVGAVWVSVGWIFITIFGLIPLAVLLVILIIAILAVVVSQEKVRLKNPEFKPWNPNLIPPLTT